MGNSVIVIEHNLDVIKCADHVIDMGPEGGDNGGRIVSRGTPEEVSAAEGSYTGLYLREVLGRKKPRRRGIN
jgi:excinuclease ABC subunit A